MTVDSSYGLIRLMKFSLPSLLLILFLLAPAVVLAENATPSSNVRDRGQKSASLSASIKTLERKEKVASREGTFKLQRDKLKSALSAKLKTHKDQKRAQIIDRVDEMLNTVNANRTKALVTQLEKITQILGRVEERSVKAGELGRDTTLVDQAITRAKTSIDQAQISIDDQKNRDYTVSISSESAARAEVKIARDNLGADLKVAHLAVKAARDAVREAIQALNLLKGETNGQ